MNIAGQRLPMVMATRPVAFRRGHDGLAATVQNELGLDPHSGLTVIVRSKRGDRLKILVWDGTVLVLVYKRLEQGSFACPQRKSTGRVAIRIGWRCPATIMLILATHAPPLLPVLPEHRPAPEERGRWRSRS